jgi:hypothetical protein
LAEGERGRTMDLPTEFSYFFFDCENRKGDPYGIQNSVISEPYDGLSGPESIELNSIVFGSRYTSYWFGYCNKVLTKDLIGKKVAKFLRSELKFKG